MEDIPHEMKAGKGEIRVTIVVSSPSRASFWSMVMGRISFSRVASYKNRAIVKLND